MTNQVAEAVAGADLATNMDVDDDDDGRHDFQSHITLYHWKLYDADDQLKKYKEMVYKGNELEDEAMKMKVSIKLTEEKTEQV